jgi:hypothetical protein
MMEGEKYITDFFLEREMLRKWVVCTGFNWLRIVRTRERTFGFHEVR